MTSCGDIADDDVDADSDDPADVIMDNIDDQLVHVKPKTANVAHRSGSGVGVPMQSPRRQKQNLATGSNASNHKSLTGTSSSSTGPAGVAAVRTQNQQQRQLLPTDALGGDDTGLGSVSLDDEDQSDVDLDLDLDQDQDFVDSEHGMSTSNVRERLLMLDNDLERQIESRFRETMANIAGDVRESQRQRPPSTRQQRQFDLESVRTDDFESEFQKTVVRPDFLSSVGHTTRAEPASSRPVRQKRAPSIASQDNVELFVGVPVATDEIDNMSVRTEDFEAHFTRSANSVKLIANTPVTTFDQFIVDSDVDTVASQSVRDTFQNVLARQDRSRKLHDRLSSTLPRRTPASRRKRESSPSSDIDVEPERPHQPIIGQSKARQRDIEKWKEGIQVRQRSPVSTGSRRSPPQRTSNLSRHESLKRLSRPASVEKLALDNKADLELSSRLKQELVRIQNEIKLAMQNKQALQTTNEKLQSLAAANHLEILNIEKQLRDSRTAAETVRAETVMIDLKRDAARKDLESLTAEIDNRRLQLQRIVVQQQKQDDELQTVTSAATEATSAASAAAVAEDLVDSAAMEELEARNRQLLEELAQIRDENKQLAQELTSFNERIASFQQALNGKDSQVSELNSEKQRMQKSITKLEEDIKRIEQEKRDFVQKKNAEYEAIKAEIHSQLELNRDKSSKEVARLVEQIEELSDQLRCSSLECQQKDDLTSELRQQLATQTEELERLKQYQTQLVDENMRSLRGIIKEKEAAINAIKEQAEEEKHAAIEEVRRTLGSHHQKLLQEQDTEFNKQLSALQGQLTGKDLELQVLRDRVQELNDWANQVNERAQQEVVDKVQAAVTEERLQWESEKASELRTQMETMKQEVVASSRQLREELQSERSTVSHLKQQISQLQEELEKAQVANRSVYRESLHSAERNEILSSSLGHMSTTEKQRYQEQLQVTTDKLNDVIRKQKDELDRLRRENRELNAQVDERLSNFDNFERKLMEDLEEECEKLLLCISQSSTVDRCEPSSQWSSLKASTTRTSDVHSALQSTVSNLKTSCDKLREITSRQHHDLEAQRRAATKLTADAKDELDQLRRHLQDEKNQALEALKARLIRDHLEEVQKLHKSLGKGKSASLALREKDRELQEIQRNMKAWKEQTLAKLANKFRDEMNRELARRQLKATVGVGSGSNKENLSHSVDFGSPSKSAAVVGIGLQREDFTLARSTAHSNPLVRYKAAGSVPDLTSATLSVDVTRSAGADAGVEAPSSGNQIQYRQLQLQMQRAEAKFKMAEERARNNEQLLNQKLVEVSKLQSVVSKQNKDLQQLQQAVVGSAGRQDRSTTTLKR